MSTIATVNYHVRASKTQSYYIDADGEKGKVISPELETVQVNIEDLRGREKTVDFLNNSLMFTNSPSKISNFRNESGWQDIYNRELKTLLRQNIGAKEVVIFDHTVRIDDGLSKRKPARNVHSDYSPKSAKQRLKDILGSEKAVKWEEGHFGFVNVWRPVEDPIESAPLGFVQPQSVQPDDWITIEVIHPDRIGEIKGLVYSENHRWLYLSKMTPDEIVVFNNYDNQGLSTIGHSAVDLCVQENVEHPRKSIESRMIVRY